MNKIRVLIIDDSALVRTLLKEILVSDENIEVVATASDPFIAREKIKRYNPDVLTLDIEMPRMDGIRFLKNIMRLRPMPVVMISSLTEGNHDLALEALDTGAVDYVNKPTENLSNTLRNYSEEIIEKVKSAVDFNVDRERESVSDTSSISPVPDVCARSEYNLIAIGASTGGTEAISEIMSSLYIEEASVFITQHIPYDFCRSFIRRIKGLSRMNVVEAKDRMIVRPGYVYMAPGNRHLLIKQQDGVLICVLDDGEPCNRHKPSVDCMFDSLVNVAPENTVAILLTGMGKDGAKGMENLHNSGALTIAQDEASSIVWGMPGEAVRNGAVDCVLPLSHIADKVSEAIAPLQHSVSRV